MFVLWVFPLGADALFEKVVIGFELQLGDGRDIVLYSISHRYLVQGRKRKSNHTKTPQNSSTESKVTTSLSRSFQLSPF